MNTNAPLEGDCDGDDDDDALDMDGIRARRNGLGGGAMRAPTTSAAPAMLNHDEAIFGTVPPSRMTHGGDDFDDDDDAYASYSNHHTAAAPYDDDRATIEAAALKTSATEAAAEEHRLKQRLRQISFGRNTLGYTKYLALVPKHTRCRDDIWTPDVYSTCSKRNFDGLIRAWRRRLHQHDPTDETTTAADAKEKDTGGDDTRTQGGGHGGGGGGGHGYATGAAPVEEDDDLARLDRLRGGASSSLGPTAARQGAPT